jgi:hypothetical protein
LAITYTEYFCDCHESFRRLVPWQEVFKSASLVNTKHGTSLTICWHIETHRQLPPVRIMKEWPRNYNSISAVMKKAETAFSRSTSRAIDTKVNYLKDKYSRVNYVADLHR